MNPEVISVAALSNARLRLRFANGEVRVFDASPYIGRGIFQRLRDPDLFARARVVAGCVEWPSGLDLSNDTLYLDSIPDEQHDAA